MSLVNKAVLAFVALALLMLAPRAAVACSCGNPSVRPCAAYWKARAVFAGVVTKVADSGVRGGGGESVRPFYYKLVRFKVSDRLRGPRGGTAEVLTAPRAADCGYNFVSGRRYLVYAEEGADGRSTRVSVPRPSRSKKRVPTSRISAGSRLRRRWRPSMGTWSSAGAT